MSSVGIPYQRGGSWYYSVTIGGQRVDKGPYKTEAGARRANSRQRTAVARADAARSIVGVDFPEWDGTLDWYQRAMAVLVQKIIAGGTSDQRNDLRAISDAARTAKMLYDQSDVERRIKKIEDDDAKIEAERKHAMRVVRPGDDRP